RRSLDSDLTWASIASPFPPVLSASRRWTVRRIINPRERNPNAISLPAHRLGTRRLSSNGKNVAGRRLDYCGAASDSLSPADHSLHDGVPSRAQSICSRDYRASGNRKSEFGLSGSIERRGTQIRK